VEGLIPVNADEVVEAFADDSEVGQLGGHRGAGDFVVENSEHSVSGLVLNGEKLEHEVAVETRVRSDFHVHCLSCETVGVQQFEVAHVVQEELVVLLGRNRLNFGEEFADEDELGVAQNAVV
jgi:hypothetical protein